MTPSSRSSGGDTDDGTIADEEPSRPSPLGELVLIVAMYLVYSFIRNTFGSASVDPQEAYENALRVIDVEEALGIYHERSVQQAFVDHEWFIRLWNIFYGSFHFIVPVVVLVLLWSRSARLYRRWRTTIMATTLLGLVGFSLFPLMPPRLLCDCPYGSGVDHGYVDTLLTVGGLWNFDSGGIAELSNQYAAMPSLHVGWALWCAAAASAVARRRWVRWAVWTYPLATTFAVVVTGNHFLLDAVGGAVVLVAGYGVALLLEAIRDRWRGTPAAGPAGRGEVPPAGAATAARAPDGTHGAGGIVTGPQHGATVGGVPDESPGST